MRKLVILLAISALVGCKKNTPAPAPTPAPPLPQTYSASLTYTDNGQAYSFSEEHESYACGCLKVGGDFGRLSISRGRQFDRNLQGHYKNIAIQLPIDSSGLPGVLINHKYKIYDGTGVLVPTPHIGNVSFSIVSASGTDNTAPGIDSVNYFNVITSISYLGNHRYDAAYERATVCEYEIAGNFKTRVRNDVSNAERDISGSYKLRIGFLAK